MKKFSSFIAVLIISLFSIKDVCAMSATQVGTMLVLSFIGILLFWFLVFLLFFMGAVFWVWMFIDCISRRDYKDPNGKLLWVIVLLFTSILGSVLYYFLVKRKLKKAKKKR